MLVHSAAGDSMDHKMNHKGCPISRAFCEKWGPPTPYHTGSNGLLKETGTREGPHAGKDQATPAADVTWNLTFSFSPSFAKPSSQACAAGSPCSARSRTCPA